ncbi:Crp/Fnr family transcriptional regulator [Nocardia sp. NPDC088792]|uniref:Crp/Fnr family transcriptional regulator n=1 Tax=Nocardia sp. NPDC088792 TaxID=3364332 RepID=UPI00380C3BDD
MDSEFSAFVTAMRAVAPIPDAEFVRAQAIFRPVRLARGDHFAHAGTPADKVGFLVEGLLRAYYLTEDGVDRTKSFREPGQLVCPYGASLRKQVSDLFIQALAPSVMLVTDRARFDELTMGDPGWGTVMRRLTERHFLEEESAHRRFLVGNAEARYDEFLHDQGHLADRLSGRHTASYLGITPEALSRIRTQRRRAGVHR